MLKKEDYQEDDIYFDLIELKQHLKTSHMDAIFKSVLLVKPCSVHVAFDEKIQKSTICAATARMNVW